MVDEVTIPEDSLETLSPSGVAPSSRLNSASSAYAIVMRLIRADEERDRKRSKIQGQIDGNPPYPKASLKRLGQSNRSNVNFRQAEGIRDSRKTSYYELLMEVETLVELEIQNFNFKPDAPKIDYAAIIAEEFTTLLTSWPGFWYNMMLHQEQMVTWGIGNCYWDNELDFRFNAVRIGGFLVPDGTKALLDDFSMCGIRTTYQPFDLFEKVKDDAAEAASLAAGWNVKLVKEMIRKSAEKTDWIDKSSIGEWSSLQSQIKENDLAFGYNQQDEIKATHLLYKEFNDKVSHMIVIEDAEVNNKKDANEKQKNWLFRKIDRFEKWDHAVCLFFAGIGEGTYHSVRGMGAKIYSHCVINDRLMNTTVDGAMASATILLQPANDSQKEKVRLVRVGPFSIMPSGYNVVAHGSFQPNLNGLVGIQNLLSANLNQNVGMYRPDVTQDEKTPQGQNQMELRNRASKEAKLEKADINLYYIQWDTMYQEMLRRVLNPKLVKTDPGGEDVKKFLKACKHRGVPDELLTTEHLLITARRAIGVGSPVMRSMISADILSVSPYFDEKGKDNAVRDYISARAGQRAVKRYKPAQNRNLIPSNDTSLAALENNDLKEGQDCIVGVDQPQVIHIMTHMTPLVKIADQYEEGKVDPMQFGPYLRTALRHVAQHLDYIAQDPSRVNEYKSFMKTFNDLVKLSALIDRQIATIQKEQQRKAQENADTVRQAQEQSQSGEEIAKLKEIENDFKIRVMKEQGNQRVREVKAQHGMELQERTAIHNMRLKELEATQE